jgi:hypothetical protein
MYRFSIAVFAFMLLSGVEGAQQPALPATSPVALDQIGLAGQFIGLWRAEESADSVFFLDMQRLGDTAFTVTTWYAGPTGERVREARRLYGYDKNSGKYVGMTVRKATGDFGLSMFWFTAAHKCEGFNYKDPFNANGSISRRFVVEFKEPDEWFQSNVYPDGRPDDTEKFRRIRSYSP